LWYCQNIGNVSVKHYAAAGTRYELLVVRTGSNGSCLNYSRQLVQQVTERMSRLHCLVIGPGLGRCPLVMKAVAKIIQNARDMNLFMILDADALYMLSIPQYRNIVQGYDKVILTPNIVEYQRLFGDTDDRNAAAVQMMLVSHHGRDYRQGKAR
jgi:NAD(P)H-hydrate repair Nnr-like enzyme with NAD(P)H-hydrate dehydratase domain